MRLHHASRLAWALSAALAITVLLMRASTEGIDLRWLVGATIYGLSSALLGIGFTLRQRAKDEPVINELLESELRRLLNPETK